MPFGTHISNYETRKDPKIKSFRISWAGAPAAFEI